MDRINNDDREYGPGKVRWADKRTQNNNKGDTILFHLPDGSTITASRLAKLQGVSTSTIRKRTARGWSDNEIIAGKRSALAASPPASPGRRQRNDQGGQRPLDLP